MSWKKLQAESKVHAYKTSKKELDDLRAVILRDLEDAAIQELSDDRRFATAYNAALQTAKMAIACAGYQLAAHRVIIGSRLRRPGSRLELLPPGTWISLKRAGASAM